MYQNRLRHKRRFAVSSLCFLLILLSSCSSLRQASLTEVELLTPESYSASAQNSDETPLYQWWEQFSDERLNQFLVQSLEKNLELRQGLEQLAQAYAQEEVANSALFPQISAVFGVERRRNNVSAFSQSFTSLGAEGEAAASSGVTTTTYRASVPLSWEIDLWGKLLASSQAAELETFASAERVQAVSLSVASQTVDTYYQAVEQCLRLELLAETIRADEEFAEIVQKRYRRGVADALDIYQAGQNLAVRKSERPTYELELRRSLSALAVLLGEYPAQREFCSSSKLPILSQEIPTGVPADLLQFRPDVKEAFFQLYAADRRLASAFRDRLPSLVLTASGGYEDLEFDKLFRPETLVWRLVGEATQTVFDGGRKAAQVQLQEAVVGERGAAYVQKVLTAFKEVEDALEGAELLAERLELLKTRVDSTRRTKSYSMQQYMQGLGSYLTVLDAQRALYLAESELLAAKRAMVSNQVNLARAVGLAWQSEVLQERFLRRRENVERGDSDA